MLKDSVKQKPITAQYTHQKHSCMPFSYMYIHIYVCSIDMDCMYMNTSGVCTAHHHHFIAKIWNLPFFFVYALYAHLILVIVVTVKGSEGEAFDIRWQFFFLFSFFIFFFFEYFPHLRIRSWGLWIVCTYVDNVRAVNHVSSISPPTPHPHISHSHSLTLPHFFFFNRRPFHSYDPHYQCTDTFFIYCRSCCV